MADQLYWMVNNLIVSNINKKIFNICKFYSVVVAPFVVVCADVAPLSNSDLSSLSSVISMTQAVPNLCVSREVFPQAPS